ncbi:MAG: glycoside hydrolase family 5 protein [Megasphaera sp.]|jgi:endoglucanase|nr:glycoside hydrolase family 5 protein [Megasphaera sp.]
MKNRAWWYQRMGIFVLAMVMIVGSAFLGSVQALDGVSVHGQLRVDGINLVDHTGMPTTLHGMSTHGMQWFGKFASAGSFRTLRDKGANVIRIAMYTDEGGYISNPSIKNTVYQAMDAAIANDLYVIVDWHILHDGNPRTHETEAASFFDETAARYSHTPAVLYEICNEPNGNVSWNEDIKPYAEHIIPIIRAHAPEAVVLVGTPTWSQDVNVAADSPLAEKNVMYTCHFYAGTHGADLRNKIDAARQKGAAVFVSEWGTSAADGNGGPYIENSRQWLDFMKQRQMRWVNWSLCDKNESSAALQPGASTDGGWTDANISASGRFVFSQF